MSDLDPPEADEPRSVEREPLPLDGGFGSGPRPVYSPSAASERDVRAIHTPDEGGSPFEAATREPYDAPITCRCCGRQQRFATPQEAHASQWDVAPYFTVSPICDRCLSSLYMRGDCRHSRGVRRDTP